MLKKDLEALVEQLRTEFSTFIERIRIAERDGEKAIISRDSEKVAREAMERNTDKVKQALLTFAAMKYPAVDIMYYPGYEGGVPYTLETTGNDETEEILFVRHLMKLLGGG